MLMPHNQEGYKKSSPITAARTSRQTAVDAWAIDDNVHMANTIQLALS